MLSENNYLDGDTIALYSCHVFLLWLLQIVSTANLIAHESGQVHWFPSDLFKSSSLLNSNLNANMHSQMLRFFLIRRAAPLNSSVFHARSLVTGKSLWTKKILDDSDVNTRKVKKEISDLPEKELYPEYTQTDKGVVYDKKPFKYPCIEGKAYVWCSCGRSHKQVINESIVSMPKQMFK